MLIGSLFRNTNGAQRGAQGTDSDTHTQRYALRISTTALVPAEGTPLVEALQITNPLRAALASVANQPEPPMTLPATGSLASTPTGSPALVRVIRPMGEVKGSAKNAQIQARVALRLYRPDADGTPDSVVVTMGVLGSGATAELITALEEPIAGALPFNVENGAVTVPANYAITTVAVTANRPTPAD